MANRNGNKRLPMATYVNAIDDHGGGSEAWEYLKSQGYHPEVIAAKATVAESKGYVGSGTTIKYVWLIHNPFKQEVTT